MIDVLTLIPNTIGQEELDSIQSKIMLAFKEADGLLSLKISAGHIMSPGGPPPYSKVIEASFESLELLMAWTESPAAQSLKGLFVDSGIVRLFYEVDKL